MEYEIVLKDENEREFVVLARPNYEDSYQCEVDIVESFYLDDDSEVDEEVIEENRLEISRYISEVGYRYSMRA